MKNILLICKKELKSYFASPIAYLLMAFFGLENRIVDDFNPPAGWYPARDRFCWNYPAVVDQFSRLPGASQLGESCVLRECGTARENGGA